MGRQRLTIGTFGEISYLRTTAGRTVARARYRDWDGKTRLVQATAETRLALLQSRKTHLVDVNTVVARKAGQLAADLGLKT